eukprot:Protomagalhaensia_sp_Gyna_25__729@NODE_1346_length_1923_cov_5_622611_g1078_i0_p1_GENE_NODE_1346_length_1923_cov_5_622611_g1078_i0NODE_1346_length_1923_cov_5_622611_g1078_i0_p1_ORF_typecomplete_len536_score80_48SNase/PF00565_17/8_3e08SNase/PF00565_17/3_3e03SNase/PF00565_17/1_2e09SNase/PF00565_17/8_2e05TUDOR/PF00567_24/1_1e22SMN/PF06003_12/8_3e03SMN/PF06003_12/6_9e07LBR_tudor/PF09465_10/0_00018Tudor_3/PF18115_1/0_0036Agenet/PF05641_12/9e03Agenet/PF05641_12/0_72_NODE_1346_length_1923_cov_5_622611_g
MLEAEQAAQEQKIGIYSVKEAPKHRTNDLCGSQNSSKARAMLASFRREGKIRVQIDAVMNGARYRCTAYELAAQMTFVLSGIRAPAPARLQATGQSVMGDPLASEAIAWARFHLLHRKFFVEVNACDRAGSFIGQMWRMDGSKETINSRILTTGLAYVDATSIQFCPIASELQEAEVIAVKKRVGLWALPEAVEEWEGQRSTSEVLAATVATATERPVESRLAGLYICHVESPEAIYCQLKDEDARLNEVQTLANKLGDQREDVFSERFTVQKAPRVGDIILARFSGDNAWYRARVTAIESAKAALMYIDFGNREKVPFDRLLKCPPELNAVTHPPMAMCFAPAGVRVLPEQAREALKLIEELGSEELEAIPVNPKNSMTGVIPAVLRIAGTDNSVSQELTAAGVARVATASGGNYPAGERTALVEKERKAKSERLGIWFYGDVGNSDDEAPDADMPPLARRRR